MTSTLFTEDPRPPAADASISPQEPSRNLAERVRLLENELGELRATVTRLADLLVAEVRETRERNQQFPPPAAEPAPVPLPPPGLVTALGAVAAPLVSNRRRWVLTDLLRDVRTTFQMYLDPRYRVRRGTQLMVPLIVGVFILNCVFFNGFFTIPIISTILEKLIDFMLAILLYKVLFSEMERYRDALAQYAVWKTHQATTSDYVMMTTDSEHPPTTRQETE